MKELKTYRECNIKLVEKCNQKTNYYKKFLKQMNTHFVYFNDKQWN